MQYDRDHEDDDDLDAYDEHHHLNDMDDEENHNDDGDAVQFGMHKEDDDDDGKVASVHQHQPQRQSQSLAPEQQKQQQQQFTTTTTITSSPPPSLSSSSSSLSLSSSSPLDDMVIDYIAAGILNDLPGLMKLLRSVPPPQVPCDEVLHEIFIHWTLTNNESAMKLLLQHLNQYVGEDGISLRFKNMYLQTLINCGYELEAIKMFQAMKRRFTVSQRNSRRMEQQEQEEEQQQQQQSHYHPSINFLTHAIMIQSTSRHVFPTIRNIIFNVMIKDRYQDFSPAAYTCLYNCMLEKLIALQYYNEAIDLFTEMTKYGAQDHHHASSSPSSSSRLPLSDVSSTSTNRDTPKPPMPNMVTFSIMMKAFWMLRDVKRANAIFSKLDEQIALDPKEAEQELIHYQEMIDSVSDKALYVRSDIDGIHSIYEIAMYGVLQSPKRVRQIFQRYISLGFTPSVRMYNIMMDSEVKHFRRMNLPQSAKVDGNVTEKIGEPFKSVFTPAPHVFDYGLHDNPNESLLVTPLQSKVMNIVDVVLNLCKEMHERYSILPDRYSMMNLMHAFCVSGKPEQAYKVMVNVFKQHKVSPRMTAKLYAVLIRYYSKIDPDRALELIDEMESSKIVMGEAMEEGDNGRVVTKPIEQRKTSALAGVREMNAIIRVYCGRNEVNKAVYLMQSMREKYGIEPDRFTLKHLADGYIRKGLLYKAIELLVEAAEKMEINLDSNAKSGLLFNAKQRKRDYVGTVLNQLIREYTEKKELANVEQMIYQVMPSTTLLGKFTPDVTSVNGYMRLLIYNGRLSTAINVFKTMFRSPHMNPLDRDQESQLLTPNDSTISIVINAFAISDLMEHGEELFKQVQNGELAAYGVPTVTPNMVQTLIAGYERMGDVARVRYWTEKLRECQQIRIQ